MDEKDLARMYVEAAERTLTLCDDVIEAAGSSGSLAVLEVVGDFLNAHDAADADVIERWSAAKKAAAARKGRT